MTPQPQPRTHDRATTIGTRHGGHGIRRCCPIIPPLSILAFLIYGVIISHLYCKITAIEDQVQRLSRDGIALRDFAWRYNGARIVDFLTTHPTKNGTEGPSRINSPFVALDDDLRPGRCWPFHGSVGQLGIRLPVAVRISHVTVDHLPKELALSITNAPRNIKIWGFVEKAHSSAGTHESHHELPMISHPDFTFIPIATFYYNIHSPDYIQTFNTLFADIAFQGVVMEILGNWGGERTCIYRVRVHGETGF